MSKSSLFVRGQRCHFGQARNQIIIQNTSTSTRTRTQQAVLKMQARQASNTAAPANPFLIGATREDFKKIEATRSTFDYTLPIEVTKAPEPDWKYGDGFKETAGQSLRHVEIDVAAPGRRMIDNYKILISGIPRPISFVSTVSKDGKRNLSPFSYFQVVDHDPPILVIGFSGRAGRPKDTRANLIETGECVISVVSEHMIDAVNATSLDVPFDTSEWELSGLKSAPSSTVKPDRVKDAIFSMEGKLLEMKDLDYGTHTSDKPAGALAIIQVTRFWIREDALNEKQDEINLEAMRPLVQLGGIAYGRVRETFELPRPKLKAELEDDSRGLKEILDAQDQS